MDALSVPSPAPAAARPAAARTPAGPVWRLTWLTPPWCRVILAVVLAFGFVSHVRYLTHDCPIDLSGDEAHYWDWSRQLDLSYYSKGPLVAYIIRASCWAFGRDTMFAVRFPALVLGAATSVVTYLLTRKLFKSERLALGVVLLYHTVPLFAAGSVLMTIDPPFFFCWALATYFTAFAVFDGRRWAWGAIGLAAGVGALAKFGMLLWFVPLVLFLATDRAARPLLRSPRPWLALLIALLCLTPVAVWNATHGWVSFLHVSTQTGATSGGKFQIGNVLEFVGGQVGILGLGLFVIMTGGVLYAIRPWGPNGEAGPPLEGPIRLFVPKPRRDGPEPNVRELRFLACFGVGFLALTFLASFRTKVQMNWPAPAYFALMILAAYFLATRLRHPRTWRPWKWWFYPTIVIGLVLSPIVHDVEIIYPAIRGLNDRGPAWRESDNRLLAWLGRRVPAQGIDVRQVDFTAKLKGWEEFGQVLSDEVEALGPGAFVLCNDYQQTAWTSFYMRGQPKTFYAGSYWKDDPKRRTQYDLWPDRTLTPPNERIGRNAIFVGNTDSPFGDLRRAFERVEGVTLVKDRVVDGNHVLVPVQRSVKFDVVRKDLNVRTFRYFRCYGFKGMTRDETKTTH